MAEHLIMAFEERSEKREGEMIEIIQKNPRGEIQEPSDQQGLHHAYSPNRQKQHHSRVGVSDGNEVQMIRSLLSVPKATL